MRHPVTPVLPLWAALLIAAGAGPILDAGFPDKGWWPLTFVGIGLVLVTLIGRKANSALLVGFVAGMTFYLVHIEWASLFLGLLPMTALSVLESLFFALGALAITYAYRWLPAVFPGVAGRILLLPVVVAGLWTAREAWASVWPYGGFAWGRVSLSLTESPFAHVFALVGVSGLSFLMVFLVAVAIQAGREASRIARLRAATVVVLLATAVVTLPTWQVPTTGTLSVAAVQGDGPAGYFDERQAGDLLEAQVSATLPLIQDDVEADVVIWPEGGSDYDPAVDGQTARVFDYISTEFDAPFVTWAVTQRGDEVFNTSLLWEAGEGETDYYDKKHPVPFGEYVPDREFWEPFAPDLIGLIGRDYTPGTTDAVFDIDGVLAGINICFDIVDDQLMQDTIDQGAEIIFAQSNNGDFGHTDESVQQLAIARARAIELGRSVVNVSTVGTSAIILPDGSTLEQLPTFEPGALVADVPLATTITPAMFAGRQLEWFVSGLALAALIIAGLASRSDRRRRNG